MSGSGAVFPSDPAYEHLMIATATKLFGVTDSSEPGWIAVGDILEAARGAALGLVNTETENRQTTEAAIEAQLAAVTAGSLSVVYVFGGKPSVQQAVNVPLVQPVTLPINFSGCQAYAGTLPTGDMVFIVNKVAPGGTVQLGSVTLHPSGHFSGELSQQAAVTLTPPAVLQVVAPATQDATGADIGITLTTARA